MKLSNLSTTYLSHTQIFKAQNDWHVLGYDEGGQQVRDAIRQWHNEYYMPYQSIYENGYRMTEGQLQDFISDLRSRNAMERVGDSNIFRGQTLVDKPCELFNLKDKGIQTVIDLVGYGDSYSKKVADAGMKYYCYPIYDNWWNRFDFSDRAYIDDLVKFLEKMQEGNIYIGCQHGSNDTDIALILNNFFNPKLEDKCKTEIPPSDFEYNLNAVYDALTKKDKIKLGWTKEFEQRLIKKLISI